MKFKVGDKILCKHALVTNNRYDGGVEGQKIHFWKGIFYKIVDYKEHDGEWVFVLKSELSDACRLNEGNVNFWFYSNMELRKLKLEKLKENE